MSIDEIFGDRHLKWIANEWAARSSTLAHWAMRFLVNRTDVWGQYSIRNSQSGARVTAVTLPVADLRNKKSDMVTLEKLERHFKGRKAGHLIGLHCVSPWESCRWFAVDLDVHDEASALEQSDNNFNAARAWFWKLRDEYALDPCILSSNGKGGLHLLCLLDGFYPLADVFNFLVGITSDFRTYGLSKRPELFPASEKHEHLGKWLRLPGRHHTYSHFTQIWSDDSDYDDAEQWLEGQDAINYLLNLRPMPLPDAAKNEIVMTGSGEDYYKRRPRVCVDLDKTIAEYDGWRGIEHIGKPIAGAREFLEELIRFSEVIIYTSRCNPIRSESNDIELLKYLIVQWLETHSMPYSEVYTGQGKPFAHAFVDDRAVHCAPQERDDRSSSFEEALRDVRRLCEIN